MLKCSWNATTGGVNIKLSSLGTGGAVTTLENQSVTWLQMIHDIRIVQYESTGELGAGQNVEWYTWLERREEKGHSRITHRVRVH